MASDLWLFRTLVLGDKFTYDRYYSSHSSFKPKQVDTLSLTSKTITCWRLKTRIGPSENRTKVYTKKHWQYWKYASFHIHIYCLSNHQQNRVCSAWLFAELTRKWCEVTHPLFWREKDKTGFSTVLLPLRDVSSPPKFSWGVYRRKALRWIFGCAAANVTAIHQKINLTIFLIETT